MFDRVGLKQMAKEQISGKIGILFLCYLIVGALAYVAGLTVVGVIATPALSLGVVMIYLNLTKGLEPKVADVFGGFNMFGKSLALYFLMGLFTYLWTLLLIVPGIVKSYAYSMAPYILAENPEMSALDAIAESKRITQGKKMDLFVLDLSFIGWGLLTGITFGIVGIYAIPYMSATKANCYNVIK